MLGALLALPVAADSDVLAWFQRHRAALAQRHVGWIDLHLLYAAERRRAVVLTGDSGLALAAFNLHALINPRP